MKTKAIFILAGLLTMSLLIGCGPDEEEQQQQMQARQDSLERVQRQQRMRQQRQDSLAAARADSIAAANAVNEQGELVFNPQGNGMNEEGNYAVQVGAWRSKAKAQRLAEEWQPRGFENAFEVKYGNEATGNIWFRVRLGKFFTREEAQRLQTWLMENYQTESWVTYVE